MIKVLAYTRATLKITQSGAYGIIQKLYQVYLKGLQNNLLFLVQNNLVIFVSF